MPNRNILVVISAILTSFATPPLSISALILVALSPLFYTLYSAKTPKKAAIYGLIFGTTYMAIYHLWIFSLHPFAPLWALILLWATFSLYLGLFYSIPAGIVRYLSPTIPIWISAPSLFTVFEYLRQLGPIGNPGGDVGYTIVSLPQFANVASIGGIFLVSFLIFTLNALLAEVANSNGRKKISICFLLFLIIGIWLGTGQLIQYSVERKSYDTTQSVVIVQGNHPQMDKFSPELWKKIKSDYLKLSRLSNKNNVIIWPETITPTLNLDDFDFVSKLNKLAHQKTQTIVFGTPTKTNGKFYNSAVVIPPVSTNGPATYQKNKLMPFGEYWPFKSYLERLGLRGVIGADYAPSHDHTPIRLNQNLYLGIAICLESIYPEFLRNQTNSGATMLVVLANNAWFFDSSAAEKHFEMTRMRAIENRRWLCLSSNTGVSAVITPLGRPIAIAPRDKQTVITAAIGPEQAITLYTKLGDWIIGLSILIAMGSIIISRTTHR